MIDTFHLSNITHRLFSASYVPHEHADALLSGELRDKGVTHLWCGLCRPDKLISISSTKAVVIAFEEQRLPEVTDGVGFLQGQTGQIEAERHNWMSQEKCPCLIYRAGLPSWAL